MRTDNRLYPITRTIALAGLLASCAMVAHAQRGPGGPPPGGPPGGGAGGMMGPREEMRDRAGAPAVSVPPPLRRGLQLAPPGRWWDDRHAIKHLGIRQDQQKRMDDLFEANKAQLETLLGNLQREETHLANLTPDEMRDEGKVFAAIDRVTQARAELEKADAHIELQLRQQLDPAQLAVLDKDLAEGR